PFFFFNFSSGICSPSAYFLAVLQLMLWISAISLMDKDLSFLKHLIELTSGIVSIPFTLHCFDSTPITVGYYLEAGKPFFFHPFSSTVLCSFTLHYYVLLYCHKHLRASIIPERNLQKLREPVQCRRSIIEVSARRLNRIQKILEGANIKQGSVVSDITGV